MIEQIKIDRFDEIYEIMEKSFPDDEFRPYCEQKELFLNEKYKVYGNITDGRLSSFIATWDFEDFVFIEHFATSPNFRNMGIGEKMLKHLSNTLQKRLCLEVEPPNEEIQKRRVDFYRRNGFFLNTFSYTQPPISKGKSPVPLMIMTTCGEVSEDEFLAIKNTLYREVYKINENKYQKQRKDFIRP